ncbi:hypothetical protein EVAR_10382_1 [Eumeta japonica]|uniref:Uncharacterized protein n=1 Tax=Eumeta variegata TaxID=151549 RepID=A0A4C1UCQ6_EUMVA|nr:hypothetical protein EVAR_10382_1 [Eumeta japonica]
MNKPWPISCTKTYYSTLWRTVGKSNSQDAPASQNAKTSKPANSSQNGKVIKAKAPTAAKVATDEADVIATPTPKKSQKPPPLFIHDKGRWSEIRKQCVSKSIAISNARNTARGLKVQPVAIPDFRNLSVLLATLKVAYHTYSLKEEREFRSFSRSTKDRRGQRRPYHPKPSSAIGASNYKSRPISGGGSSRLIERGGADGGRLWGDGGGVSHRNSHLPDVMKQWKLFTLVFCEIVVWH